MAFLAECRWPTAAGNGVTFYHSLTGNTRLAISTTAPASGPAAF